ncbi:hypothetical protein M0811_07044 [Anaeramoeba ignava]|uniref:Uncharacterized protein n=1 Tax=Anaeramoeba ignava TaxID=1746090 RepID=A0A9Q0LPA0_ANAIG|nr:hypothetical protein M0811_07044 [Anaeramoeba ignava]
MLNLPKILNQGIYSNHIRSKSQNLIFDKKFQDKIISSEFISRDAKADFTYNLLLKKMQIEKNKKIQEKILLRIINFKIKQKLCSSSSLLFHDPHQDQKREKERKLKIQNLRKAENLKERLRSQNQNLKKINLIKNKINLIKKKLKKNKLDFDFDFHN